jgi:hypothetical protein
MNGCVNVSSIEHARVKVNLFVAKPVDFGACITYSVKWDIIVGMTGL